MARFIPVIGRYDHLTHQGDLPGLPSGRYTFRCFFGLHEQLVAYESWVGSKICGRSTYCSKCGSLLHIQTFEDVLQEGTK